MHQYHILCTLLNPHSTCTALGSGTLQCTVADVVHVQFNKTHLSILKALMNSALSLCMEFM